MILDSSGEGITKIAYNDAIEEAAGVVDKHTECFKFGDGYSTRNFAERLPRESH